MICEIGNGLADRMQHDGWVETLIQSKMADKKLVFRNLAFSGDTVTDRPRARGLCLARGIPQALQGGRRFRLLRLQRIVRRRRRRREVQERLVRDDRQVPRHPVQRQVRARIVLFSPIAHENLKSPNLPNGAADNVNLALYTAAMRQVAREKRVGFVDLFSGSQAYYALATTPLTLNGVHLLPEGDRQIGEIIASEVVGQTRRRRREPGAPPPGGLGQELPLALPLPRPDGNDIWGSRSGLRYVNGQSNAEVLTQELKMLDVMTANRDRQIWAVAAGRELHGFRRQCSPAVGSHFQPRQQDQEQRPQAGPA